MLKESVANMITRPGYETLDVEGTVVNTNTLGTDTKTSTGKVYQPMITISGTTQSRQLFRAGIWVKNPTGTTTLQCVRVHIVLEWEESA